MPDWLNESITWVRLASIRGSFVSKALAAIGLSAGVLNGSAAAIEAAEYGVDLASPVFLGCLLFLAGYVLFSVVVPAEFSRDGEVDEIAGRMSGLSNWDYFRSRVLMARALAARRVPAPGDAKTDLALELDKFKDLDKDTKEPQKGDALEGWADYQVGVYQADLNLRQFDRGLLRVLIALVFLGGALLVLWPTLLAIWQAVRRLAGV